MTTFAAQVKGWTEKAKRNTEFVVRGSISDVGEIMTRRQASVKDTGGTYQEGFVPVDEGDLINSQRMDFNTGTVGVGDIEYAAVLAGMEMGDTITHVFTAPHARPQEYGTDKFGGRFFVRNAVQQWQTIVAQNAALFKD